MRKLNNLILLIFAISLFLVAFISIKYENRLSIDSPNVELRSKTDTPIFIDGNGGFSGYPGYGNKTHPYLIENYVINASGFDKSGIEIQNTDAHFVIRNCTVTNHPNSIYYGVQLSNVTNGQIMNNTVSYYYGGIYLLGSDNNTISNNTVSKSSQKGIGVSSSINNTVSNNVIRDAGKFAGIYISQAENNYFRNNTLYETGIYLRGLTIDQCSQEITPDNTVNDRPIHYYRHQKGITIPGDVGQLILVNCTSLSISNCNLSGGSVGLTLLFSNNITLTNNTANNNFYGFFISQSDNIKLLNNTANQNEQDGIASYRSCYSTITDNTLTYNGVYGMMLWYSSNHSTISRNDASHNEKYGICLQTSMNITVSHNTADYNYEKGIWVYKTSMVLLLNNSFNHHQYDGISVGSSIDVNLTLNTANDNQIGLFLSRTNYSTFIHNTLNGNDWYGLLVHYYSSHNNISDNTINDNYHGIYIIEESSYNTIKGNILYGNIDCICEEEGCIGNVIYDNDCQNRTEIPGFIWTLVILGLFMVLSLLDGLRQKQTCF
ncbi:MAG: right-handed parallel beta-helix repeat-containing protein [Candidatus Helarchaeota archaeon]|nr:right-handed parallel beta-helix repeat-containing protein [Candidatus Helarchaeota archaeon]